MPEAETVDGAVSKQAPFGKITFGLFALCCMFYLISRLTAPSWVALPNNLPYMPLISAPITKELMYDYPHMFELVDKIVKLYSIEEIEQPETLPSSGQFLLRKIYQTPYWPGAYDLLIYRSHGLNIPDPLPPMFEKISEGEVWRVFTPCLLHGGILHLLFNMMWLILLGKQIEERLSATQYLLLVLIIGIVSNTCQYLVTGPNFLGFSGVLCGMVAFIWVRQKIAPSEGYPLDSSTIRFMTYFVLAMVVIEIVLSFLEIYYQVSVGVGIADTAHLSGAATGVLLGCSSFFRRNHTKFSGRNNEC